MLVPLLAEPAPEAASAEQVGARVISMQFEGNWTAVTDVIVDKVGKYAHVIGSPHDSASTPVVMDVSLDVRTKVPSHCMQTSMQSLGCIRVHTAANNHI